MKQLQNIIGFVPDLQPSIANVTPRTLFKTLRIVRGLDQTYDEIWKDYCEKFLLTKWLDRPLNWFSQGMLKRISIITGIFYHPHLLFMDEPLENLDQEGRILLEKILVELLQEDCTILITSHILSIEGFIKIEPKLINLEELMDHDP